MSRGLHRYERTPVEIEQAADLRAVRLSTTPLQKLYSDNWPIILNRSRFFVGFSPNPLATTILTPHTASKSVELITQYFEANTNRLGALPMHLFYPPKCREGVDYFDLDTPSSCMSLIWYMLYSDPTSAGDAG
jgi:hypothetical protein